MERMNIEEINKVLDEVKTFISKCAAEISRLQAEKESADSCIENLRSRLTKMQITSTYLRDQLQSAEQENERLNVCVAYWYESNVKLIDKAKELESLAADRLADIERMNRVFINQGNLREQIVDLQTEIAQLNNIIGNTSLADQEAIERRVARECHQIAASSEYGYQAAERIRARYGLEG